MATRSPDVVVDVAVFGGGIAGLWLLDRLRAAGYSAALFEADRLGAGQTAASQGIVHGGAKYTLGLRRSRAVAALKEMPASWRRSLRGVAGPDLSKARELAAAFHLWIPKQPGGGLLAGFSRSMLHGRVRRLPPSEWPSALGGAAGSVYALDDFVVDVPSVLEALRAAHTDCIRRLPAGAEPKFAEGEAIAQIGDVRVRAQRVVFAAGAGNAELLARVGLGDVPHRRRPLHQLMVAGMTQPLYAHCAGRSALPLATLTAHPLSPAEYVWYVGGRIAEDGVHENREQLIERARSELPRLFPGADFGKARFATVMVDRAEGAAPAAGRLAGPVVGEQGDFIAAWPSKLALAPALADAVVARLGKRGVRAGESVTEALAALPPAEVARPPWEDVVSWS